MCCDHIETSYTYLTNSIITINPSAKFRIWRIMIQCPRETGQAGTYYRNPVFQKGARLCCVCCCLSQQYNYLSTVQINSFSPNPSHSATASQSFRFTVQIFSRSGLAGLRGRGGGEMFFYRGPDALSAAMQPHCFMRCQTKINK
jgi:hypothetical protein